MLSLERMRELLGPGAEAYTDAQVLEIRETMVEMAHVVIDDFKRLRRERRTVEFTPSRRRSSK